MGVTEVPPTRLFTLGLVLKNKLYMTMHKYFHMCICIQTILYVVP